MHDIVEEAHPIVAGTVTVERLDRAIRTTSHIMAQHNLPQLMPTSPQPLL
jgi:hypothetical protein